MMGKRSDLLSASVWGIAIIGAALIALLGALNAIPPVVTDLIRRGYPVLFIALGLMILLGRRMRFGNALAVGVSAALFVGVATIAYNRQSTQFREDYREPFSYALSVETLSLQADVRTWRTEIEILPAPTGERQIRGEFVGSLESLVAVDYRFEGGKGIFSLTESARNPVPLLESVGRGKLTLYLPQGIAIDGLTLQSIEGSLNLNAAGVNLRAISITMQSGGIQAIFSDIPGLIGDLTARGGKVEVTIPASIPAQVALRGGGAGRPSFSAERYTLRIDNVLVPKGDPLMQLTIDAGEIVVQ